MRAQQSGTRPSRQRRRRYAAAALCLVAVLLNATSAHGLGAARPLPRPTSSGTAPAHTARGSTQVPGPATVPTGTSSASSGSSASAESASPSASASDPSSSASSAPDTAFARNALTVSDPLSAAEFPGLPQVGALFSYNGGATGSHYCTASVVASSAGDVIVTAAHCVYDPDAGTYLNDIAFVPGYHDGQQPYGVWTPSKIVVPQQWMDDADPDYDVAFLVVHQPGSDQRLQDVVGADTLGTNPSYTALAQVVGYPSSTEKPITCANHTSQLTATQLEFDCAGFPGGTSGGPFLTGVDTLTGLGTVTGVIGGYEEGGDTPDVSYSTYFGDAVATLFSQAEAAG